MRTTRNIILTSILCSLLIYSSDAVFAGDQSSATIGHPINVLSLCFQQGSQPVATICQIIDREAAKTSNGLDLVCLPEEWPGSRPQPVDGPALTAIEKVAKKNHTYIVCPVFVKRGKYNYNTSFLIDREGKIVGYYDKAFPYWTELTGKYPTRPSQHDASVFDTDFGKVGLAICFDAKFPEVFQRLEDNGAQLVVWSSAYSGYTELQAYATLHHYYIVTSTWTGDCLAYDITGHQLMDQGDCQAADIYGHSISGQNNPTNITIAHITLDMDREIFHYNFNENKLKKLLAEHGNDVFVDCDMPREQWFVLKAKRPGVSVHELARQYGLEPLLDYFRRSRHHIDELRGFDFYKKYGGYPE